MSANFHFLPLCLPSSGHRHGEIKAVREPSLIETRLSNLFPAYAAAPLVRKSLPSYSPICQTCVCICTYSAKRNCVSHGKKSATVFTMACLRQQWLWLTKQLAFHRSGCTADASCLVEKHCAATRDVGLGVKLIFPTVGKDRGWDRILFGLDFPYLVIDIRFLDGWQWQRCNDEHPHFR